MWRGGEPEQIVILEKRTIGRITRCTGLVYNNTIWLNYTSSSVFTLMTYYLLPYLHGDLKASLGVLWSEMASEPEVPRASKQRIHSLFLRVLVKYHLYLKSLYVKP